MDANDCRVDLFFDSGFSSRKAQQFSQFLNALLEAEEYAADLKCSTWEFAIDIVDAKAMGIHMNDLRWMIRKGWIFHTESDTPAHHHPKSPSRLAFNEESRFTIGKHRIEMLNASLDSLSLNDGDEAKPFSTPLSAAHGTQASSRTPSWDGSRHELRVVGRIVKRYRWPATNQETVLTAFEEEGWPPRIDDPLRPVNSVSPKRRLSDTIKCLNRNQCEKLVRFRGDGTGEGVLWDVAPFDEQLAQQNR